MDYEVSLIDGMGIETVTGASKFSVSDGFVTFRKSNGATLAAYAAGYVARIKLVSDSGKSEPALTVTESSDPAATAAAIARNITNVAA